MRSISVDSGVGDKQGERRAKFLLSVSNMEVAAKQTAAVQELLDGNENGLGGGDSTFFLVVVGWGVTCH